jgi:ATP synthase protein I
MASYLRKRDYSVLTQMRAPRILPALMTGRDRDDGAWAGMGVGWAITGTLIAGMLAWGAVGYLADRLAGTGHVLTGIGIVVGAAGGIYLVYLRYGKGDGDGTDE